MVPRVGLGPTTEWRCAGTIRDGQGRSEDLRKTEITWRISPEGWRVDRNAVTVGDVSRNSDFFVLLASDGRKLSNLVCKKVEKQRSCSAKRKCFLKQIHYLAFGECACRDIS